MFGLAAMKTMLKCTIQRHLRMMSSFTAASAEASSDGRYVMIDLKKSEPHASSASEKHKYPLIWLRDSCQCSECFHAQSKSRTIDWTKFDFKNAHPKSISVILCCFLLRCIKILAHMKFFKFTIRICSSGLITNFNIHMFL